MRSSLAIASLLSLAACTPAATKVEIIDVPPPSTAPGQCPADAGWSDPTPPRKVFGNTWYVGTCSISTILITSPEGHVLIDAATDEAAPAVEANIRALGFRVEDIRYILNTHEHHDHAGGIARLQRDSGATVLSRSAAAEALTEGMSDRRDPQFETTGRFPAVQNVKMLVDGAEVRLGSLKITNHPSPGHTAGGSSWSWRSCEGTQCRDIVFADSVTAISDKTYRYGQHPEFVAAFRSSLTAMERLSCDILITTHVQTSQLLDRLDGKAPLADPGACRRYAQGGREKLDQRLRDEQNRIAP